MISVRCVQVLGLQECGVQLEQCQLVRYNELTGTPGNTFDEPKVGTDRSVCVSRLRVERDCVGGQPVDSSWRIPSPTSVNCVCVCLRRSMQ